MTYSLRVSARVFACTLKGRVFLQVAHVNTFADGTIHDTVIIPSVKN